MASTRKLSSDEVNALIEGLGSDTDSPAASGEMNEVRGDETNMKYEGKCWLCCEKWKHNQPH